MLTIRKCGWCKKYLGWKIEAKNWKEFWNTTHGICPECKDRITGQSRFVSNLMNKFTEKK